jgi:hypothetical protein
MAGFTIFFALNELDFIKLKTKIFTINIHRLPPEVPVNSYHCTQFCVLANALPKVNQVQVKSHNVWPYSNPNHKGIKSQTPQCLLIRRFKLCHIVNTTHINNALHIMANAAPSNDA